MVESVASCGVGVEEELEEKGPPAALGVVVDGVVTAAPEAGVPLGRAHR